MTIAYADFVAAFPEFTNAQVYPQATINFWIPIAYQQINACRFKDSLDLAAMLFVAHNVALSAQEQGAANSGAPVGTANGPVSAKGVGPVSASYDTGSTAIAGAGAWNYTKYGQRLYMMMKAFAAGPSYVPGPYRRFRPAVFR